MARKQKSVYERIEEKKQEILEAEQVLATLNQELDELKAEQDTLEMQQLLQAMKEKGLTINEALAKMSGASENNDKPKKKKTDNVEE